jgi:signal transduction histidine kinase
VLVEVGQFLVAGAVALAIVGVATSIAARRAGEREAISDVRATTVLRAQGVVAPVLDDDVLTGDPAAIERLDAAVRGAVLDDDLVRVKLWTADGTIVYSDEPQLIGARYDLAHDELQSMATGAIEAEVSDLGEPENRFEREHGELLEVYLPIRTPGGEILLFEAYHRYEIVTSNATRLWRSFAPIAIGALVMLQVVQIPLAFSLARRLRQRQEEREGLLRRALEASDRERRQIASDLHDGVVQDLAGVAFALSAAARRDIDPQTDHRLIETSADTVRAGIRALRSLVVDIYPPDFDEVSLESALHDLAVRMGERDIDLRVDAHGLGPDLPNGVARLLYRVAQEGVRNVLAHADARSVSIVAASDGDRARLTVTDDGTGFPADELAGRLAEGHVGLTALRGLVQDSGGTLDVRSDPGTGTTLQVEVPLR